MSEVFRGAFPPHRRVTGGLLAGTSLTMFGMVMALGIVAPAGAAALVGASGANGTDGSSSVVGVGGDGAGNVGSGGAGQGTTGTATTGTAGTSGKGGGGGGGGKDSVRVSPFPAANGAAGGNGEFGAGGVGGTINRSAGGGEDESGGGGGFGASAAGSSGGGGGGGGGRGTTIATTDGIIDLGDSVTGGKGGAGGDGGGGIYADGGGGGGGGIGVVFGGAGVLTVDGTILGGNGGVGGDGVDGPVPLQESYGGSGGAGGTGLRVTQPGATVVVNGSVSGGDGGARGAGEYLPAKAVTGPGGAGIVGAGINVVLGPDGSISGGLGGDGTTRANAVTFSSGANSFELLADTSTVVGKVVANGTADVFRLGGTTGGNSFDTALLGTQYTGFESYEKAGTGKWTLTGTAAVATTWSVTEGTLALPGATTADIVTSGSGVFALEGGTLDGSLDNGGTTNAEGEITGAITNELGATFNLEGDLIAGDVITNDGTFTAAGSSSAGSFAVTGGSGFGNAGTISLTQPGEIVGDVLDLTAAGLFDGGVDGRLVLDIDLSAAAAASDQLLLGATAGTLQLNFDPDLSHYGALTDDVLVVRTADGNLRATATGLQDRGLVEYALEQVGTDWYVTSRLNVAPLGGIVAGMQSVQVLADASLRPIALDQADSCAAGVYTSAQGGKQGFAAATTAQNGEAVTSSVTTNHGGGQLDIDFGCLELGQGDTTLRLGLVGGLNNGSVRQEQPLPGDTLVQSSNDFSTGYAGLYGQLRSGGVIANLQFGYDSTDFDLSANILGGQGTVIDQQHTNMQRLSASSSIGYAFDLDAIILTPSAGLSYARSEVGSIQLVDLGGLLDFATRDSVTAFGSLEVSTRVVQSRGGAIRYFASGTLFSDLGDGQRFSYGDDLDNAVDLQTTPSSNRGSISAGLSYESAGGAGIGVRSDVSYAGAKIGVSISVQAGASF